MINDHKTIEFSKNWWSYSNYIIILLGILALGIFFSGLYKLSIFLVILIVFLTIFVSFIFLAWYFTVVGDYFINSLKNQQFPYNLISDKQDHDAFIIIHSMGTHFSGYPGFNTLIQFFVSKEYPLKIYHCYNPEDFKNVLKNERARYIWIFGHGWRGGVTFKWTRSISHFLTSNKSNLSYKTIQDELEKYPKKLFIGQFHCNHIAKTIPDNVSLPEILLETSNDSNYYVSNWKMNTISIWFAIRKLVKEVKRTEVPITVNENEPNAGGCTII